MHAHVFDPYVDANSPVHSLDPRIKLALAVVFIIGVALVPIGSWAALVLFLATILGAIILSLIHPAKILRRSVIALPFVLAAVPLLFSGSGNPLFSIPIGELNINIFSGGMIRFLTIVVKSWISIMAALLLSGTTNFQELLVAMRSFRINRLLVAVIGLMWRYLFILADEAIRLMRARDARSGAELGKRAGGTVFWRAKVTGGMAGSLFIRGFDRADRVYSAMLARGYDGETRSLPAPPIPRVQYAVLIAGIIWISIPILISYLIR
ncbi:MAG: cobalt ECF transporter T component CbiQ [Anaerolineales bacterium]|nr:cobalt ECF transporter T component CbiQ [Anaerolineales bacterium]